MTNVKVPVVLFHINKMLLYVIKSLSGALDKCYPCRNVMAAQGKCIRAVVFIIMI